MSTEEDEAAEKRYRSDLPGPLGLLDTFLARLEAVILVCC
jgi:hypothetical protein